MIYIPKFKYDLQQFAEADNGLFLADAEPAGGVGDFDDTSVEGAMTITGIVAAKNNGDYGYKINYDGVNDQAWGRFSSLGDLTELWVRMYVYIPSSLTPEAAWRQLYFGGIYDGNTYALWFGVESESTPTWYTWILRVQGQAIQKNATNFGMDEWHRVEAHWISDDTNGGGTLKVDGDVAITDENQDTSAYAIDNCRFGSVYSGSIMPESDYFYFDDVKGSSVDWVGPYSEAGGGRISRYHDLSGLAGHGQSTFNPLG